MIFCDILMVSRKPTFLRAFCRPGARVMQAAMVPNSRSNAYMMRVLVLFLHEGHCEQQKLQAVLPHRHASYIMKQNDMYYTDIRDL